MLLVAASWYAGLRAVHALGGGIPARTPWLVLAVSVIIAAGARLRPDRLRPAAAYHLLVAIAFILGGYRASERLAAADSALSPIGEGIHYARGRVISVEGLSGDSRRRARIVIDECRVGGAWLPAGIAADFHGGHILLVPGDLIEGHVRSSRVAGETRRERTLLAEGVGHRAYAGPDVRVTGKRWSIGRALYLARRKLSVRLARRPQGTLISGMILGDTGLIPDELLQAGRRSGALHLFVVSGLHLGLAGGLVMFLFRKIGLSLAWRNAAAIAATFGYLALTGWGAPAFRAWLMFSMLVAAPLIRRSYNPLNSLPAAVLALLAIRPEEAQRYGFHLAVAAISGLFAAGYFLAPELKRLRSPAARAVLGAAAASAAGYAGVAPFLAAYFGRVSLAAPLCALAGVPLVSWLIAGGGVVAAGSAAAGALGALTGWGWLESALEFAVGAEGPLYWFTAGTGVMLEAVVGVLSRPDWLNFAVWGPPWWHPPAWLTWICAAVLMKRHHEVETLLFSERLIPGFHRRRGVRFVLLPACAVLTAAWPFIAETTRSTPPGVRSGGWPLFMAMCKRMLMLCCRVQSSNSSRKNISFPISQPCWVFMLAPGRLALISSGKVKWQ